MVESNKNLLKSLRRIEGQIRGLEKMVEDNRYCIDIITQTSAVKQALSAVEDKLLEGHLASCVVSQIKKGKEREAQQEILRVYRLKRK